MPKAWIRSTCNALKVGTHTAAIGRLWLTLEFEQHGDTPYLDSCLIDTGAPLCVIPYDVPLGAALKWHPHARTKYFGVPAQIGHIKIWVPASSGTVSGPFDVIAKFPERTPDIFKGQPQSILIGYDFFACMPASLILKFPRVTSRRAGSVQLATRN